MVELDYGVDFMARDQLANPWTDSDAYRTIVGSKTFLAGYFSKPHSTPPVTPRKSLQRTLEGTVNAPIATGVYRVQRSRHFSREAETARTIECGHLGGRIAVHRKCHHMVCRLKESLF